MRIRITAVISKDDGKTIGYRVERSLFPFGWRCMNGMHLVSGENVDRYAVMLLRSFGKVKDSMEFV